MTEQTTGDALVADYLARVRRAAAGLAPDRVDELVDDLSTHIAASRAEQGEFTEAAVRSLLDRLGDPAAIVAEAAVGEPVAPSAPMAQRTRRGLLVALLVLVGVVVVLPVLVCVLGLVAFRVFPADGGPAEPVQSPVRPSMSVQSTG